MLHSHWEQSGIIQMQKKKKKRTLTTRPRELKYKNKQGDYTKVKI